MKKNEEINTEFTKETQKEVLAHIRRGKLYSLLPGDVVVISVARKRWVNLEKNIRMICAKVLPKGVKVICKASDIGLEVIRKGKVRQC